MLLCTAPEFVPWRPDFSSSEQPSPDWTKLVCEGVELSNALGSVDWFGEPAVQVRLCESCGHVDCESGGYVHVSRLGPHVLWTRPHVDQDDAVAAYQYRAAEPVLANGAVAIPADEWDTWRERFDRLPSADQFPRTTRDDLFAAWYLEAPLLGAGESPDELVSLARERAVAAEPSDTDAALAGLAALAEWFTAEPEAPVDGGLVSVLGDLDATVETLYFDVPDTFDRPVLREWAAYARRGDATAPVFGGALVLRPEPDLSR